MTSFLAFKNSSQSGVTGSGQWVTNIYGNKIYDNQGEYNPANGLFTASGPGKRRFTFSAKYEGLNSSHNNCALAVWRNGSEYHHVWLGHGGNGANGGGQMVQYGGIDLYLNSGDTIYVGLYAGGGSGTGVSSGYDVNPYFSGESIS